MRTISGARAEALSDLCSAIAPSGFCSRDKRKRRPRAGALDSPSIFPLFRIAADQAFQSLAVRSLQQNRLMKLQLPAGSSELPPFRHIVRDRLQSFGKLQ